MPIQPLPAILAIEPYKGGASTLPGIDKPVKLASNENALGSSPRARAAFQAAAEGLHLYPEGSARKLREALAARFGLDAARIVCGAGSDEIFFLLARAFLAPGDEIVMSEHSFLIYAIAAKQSGAVVRVAASGVTADVGAMLDCVGPRTKLVFLANPNNPTGTYLPASEVRRLQAALPDHVLLVLDAAYAEFVRRDDYESGLELAAAADNVIVTRTFSKIHGLAALRVGWGYGPPAVVDALNRTRGPFNVNTPALEAALAALEDGDFARRSSDHNAAELPRVIAALEAMGLEVTPSVCNFALAHFAPGQAAAADAHLRSKGYILRGVRAYGFPDALRMTIGTAPQNDGALAALAEFLGKR